MKAVFGKKRKQIGGSLAEFLGDKTAAHEVLQKTGIALTSRPETLSLADWKNLTETITKTKNSVQLKG